MLNVWLSLASVQGYKFGSNHVPCQNNSLE